MYKCKCGQKFKKWIYSKEHLMILSPGNEIFESHLNPHIGDEQIEKRHQDILAFQNEHGEVKE